MNRHERIRPTAMKLLSPLLFILSIAAPTVAADLLKLPELKTKSAKSFTNVTITQKLPDGIKIMHDSGMAKIEVEELPDELKAQLGGFDEAALNTFRESQKNEQQKQLAVSKLAKAKSALDRSVYEPLPSLIEKLAADAPYESDKRRLAFLRRALEKMQTVCQPLLDSEKIQHSEAQKWVQAVIDGTVTKGMPMDLVVLSKGEPNSINRTSGVVKSLVYNQRSGRLFMVFLNDELTVESWIE